jgi:hypothetical protein
VAKGTATALAEQLLAERARAEKAETERNEWEARAVRAEHVLHEIRNLEGDLAIIAQVAQFRAAEALMVEEHQSDTEDR